MKHLLLLLLLFWAIPRAFAQDLTSADRKALLGYFTDSEKALKQTIKGLSPAQLAFKPAADQWSIAECIEHLAITEPGILGMVRDQLMKASPNPDQKPAQVLSDAELLKRLSGRETKVKTRETMVPTGRFSDAQAALKAFNEARKGTKAYVKATPDRLREHYQQSPLGIIDGYQWLVFIAGHTQRHVAQMAEVKAHPNFPKQ